LHNACVLFPPGLVCRGNFHFDALLIAPQEAMSIYLRGASWTFGNAKSTLQHSEFLKLPDLALPLLVIKPVAVEHCTPTPDW